MSDDRKDEARSEEHQKLIEEKPFDFIERTKPEDRIDNEHKGRGQQTRDNVTPVIPSAKPGEGDIVDPRSLGMESQEGVAPPARQDERLKDRPQPKEVKPGEAIDPVDIPVQPTDPASINEPPGSQVMPSEEQRFPKTERPAITQTRQVSAPAREEGLHEDPDDPDALEDEIEAAEEDGDVETRHRGGKPTTTSKKKK